MHDETKDIILRWHSKAQRDYFDQYISLFISYNAWFKKVTNTSRDRQAIDALKTRSGIWLQYLNGETMQDLKAYFEAITSLTMSSPIANLTSSHPGHWNGVVREGNWQDLIEYWYTVRCNLFHGSKSPESERDGQIVKLAYKSLNVFMTEIIRRMNENFSSDDLDRLFEINLIQVPKIGKKTDVANNVHRDYWKRAQNERLRLENKFRQAQNLWEVDL